MLRGVCADVEIGWPNSDASHKNPTAAILVFVIASLSWRWSRAIIPKWVQTK
jgi:hypothetical protein